MKKQIRSKEVKPAYLNINFIKNMAGKSQNELLRTYGFSHGLFTKYRNNPLPQDKVKILRMLIDAGLLNSAVLINKK